jgi:hypothetical protein
MSATTLDELVSLDLRELKAEVKKLRDIEAWALANLGVDYTVGDRIEIVNEKPSRSQDGWKAYAEALAVGQVGVAGDIHFNGYAKSWYVLVLMDRSWSTHEDWKGNVTRCWRGPADEAPKGFTVPPYYPPEGKTKAFAMPVSWVRKAAS